MLKNGDEIPFMQGSSVHIQIMMFNIFGSERKIGAGVANFLNVPFVGIKPLSVGEILRKMPNIAKK